MAKAKVAEQKFDHVVFAVTRHGLDKTVTVFGPFTKAHAHVFSVHHQKFEGDECVVEQMLPACEHNQWIFNGVS